MNLFFPHIAYASVASVMAKIGEYIINPIIKLLFALALLYFFYGLLEFILNAENEEKRSTGKNHMLWGIIGIAIMLSVWAILGILMKTFNITGINPQTGTVQLNDYNPSYPQVQ